MSEPASTVLFRRVRRRLNRGRVRELARELRRQVAGGRPFTCLLAGDAQLRRLNRQFLGRDYPADVLAFTPQGAAASTPVGRLPRAAGRPPGRPGTGLGAGARAWAPAPLPLSSSLGDMAISVGRAAAQARRSGHDLEAEIGILMLHGLLHLLGYDHTTDRGRMRRAEARWRRKLGLPATLTERGGRDG